MIHVFVTSHGGMAEGILESVEMLIGKQENLTAITFGKEMGVDELEECYFFTGHNGLLVPYLDALQIDLNLRD